jgi:HEAT repeat protein
MAMTLEELRKQLSVVEPDDSTYYGIGPAELPLLEQLVLEPEAWLAARAVVAATRINDRRALALLQRAARDPREEVRVTLAASLKNIAASDTNAMLLSLLDDRDLGVRKFAIKSVSAGHDAAVHRKVRELQDRDPVPAIREGAASRLRQLNIRP